MAADAGRSRRPAGRQAALLANARAVLAPGGLLVYSTCSLEAEENEAWWRRLPDVVDAAHAPPSRARRGGRFLRCCDKIGKARK